MPLNKKNYCAIPQCFELFKIQTGPVSGFLPNSFLLSFSFRSEFVKKSSEGPVLNITKGNIFLKNPYIDRVQLKPPLKTSSKTTVRFYISSPQKYEQLHHSKSS